MSLKTLKDYDIMGWRGEFYFKVDGPKTFKYHKIAKKSRIHQSSGYVALESIQNRSSG